jgi:hypothetical protein
MLDVGRLVVIMASDVPALFAAELEILLTLELCCRISCLVQRMHTYCDMFAQL